MAQPAAPVWLQVTEGSWAVLEALADTLVSLRLTRRCYDCGAYLNFWTSKLYSHAPET